MPKGQLTMSAISAFAKRHRTAAAEMTEARTIWSELCQQRANLQTLSDDDWAAVEHAADLLGIANPRESLESDADALRSVQGTEAMLDSPEYHLPTVMARIETNRAEEHTLQDRLREVQRLVRIDAGAIQRRTMMLQSVNERRAAHPRVFDQEGGSNG